MRTPFRQTLAFLEDDARPRVAWIVAGVAACLAAWALWAMTSTVTIYAVATEGRLLAAGAAAQVQAPVEGTIASSRLVLGTRVSVGDVLLELDATADRLRRDEESAREGGLERATGHLAKVLVAERSLARASSVVGARRFRAAKAHAETSAKIAALARQRDDAMMRLRDESLVSGLDQLEAAADAQRERGGAIVRSAEASLASADRARTSGEARVRILTLEKELADVRAQVAASRATVARVDWEIERKTVRAAAAGTIADVAALSPGAHVSSEQILATIVPDATMRWVALLAPTESVGRVRPGQVARIRLDAFAWSTHGTLHATVARVGSEPRDQRIRVELDVDPSSIAVPLAHGMTGAAEIETDHVHPWHLLLNAAHELRRATPSKPSERGAPLAADP